MNETIRDVLKRRVRWCAAIAGIGFVGFIAVPMTAIGQQHSGPPMALAVVAWFLFAGALVGLQWFAAKCPKCSRRMGQEIAMRVGLAIRGKPPNYCPYCGVSFDEPLPNARGSVESQNPLNPIK
jgi:hypothetical protein